MKKQRKHINLSRITAFILSVAMLAGFCPQGVSLADIPITLPKVNAAENISNPRIAKDSSMDAGQKVTWDCVYFGRYPQSEITSKDGSIYNTLKNATGWDENNDITIGRTKYRRLKGEDATYATGEIDDEFEYYDWNGDYKTYHYFKYEPIKWRVLNRNGNDALLFADVALDSQKYNTNYEDVTWETSSMRSWLNGYGASVNQPKTDYSRKNFIDSAFTSTQKNAIKTTNVVNNNNIDYGTAGGNNTSDKVFLLSESEVYNTDMAEGYGFVKDSETDDEARRSRCSTYAYAMGTYRSYDTEYTKYNGNIWWWLRSPGIEGNYAAEVYKYGWGYRDGSYVDDTTDGVRPALHLNLASTNLYSYAGTVCSDAMKNGESGADNPVNPGEPNRPDTPNQPAHPDKPGTATGTRTEESNVDIEIDGGVDFTIPENVPILGGGDVSLDYGTIPITFKREDNTYRIGIGVQDMNKKDWTTFKKFVETQKESYRKGINSLLATKSGIASMGMSVEPEMKAYGYVEGTITKANGVESAGGKLVVEIKGTAKQEWQTVVVVVPVVIKVKGTAGTKADFSVGFDFNKSKVYTKGEVELTLPSVRLTGGIGVSYIADISVYGEAKNLVTVESDGKDNDITASLEGALGVSAKALCFSYEKELLNGSFDYLSTKKKSKDRM